MPPSASYHVISANDELEEAALTLFPPDSAASDHRLPFTQASMASDTDFVQLPMDNQAPSDNDLPRIRSLRQGCQMAIDAVNAQIDKLIEQRQLLEKNLERYDSLLSPVKRVPEDILSSIFLLARGTPDLEALNIIYSPRNLPTVVPSRICHPWRRLALATPSLWSTIQITPPEHPSRTFHHANNPHLMDLAEKQWQDRMKQLAGIIPLWIERSKNYPLFLILRFGTTFTDAAGWDSPEASLPYYSPLVDLACSVAPRWNKLYLTINTTQLAVVDRILALQASDVPQLEEVSLQTGNDPVVTMDPNFHPAGVLMGRSLRSLCYVRVPRTWAQLAVNWAGLTELRLGVRCKRMEVGRETYCDIKETLHPATALSLLRRCPNLVHCELAVRPVKWNGSVGGTLAHSIIQDQEQRVRLSRLTSFTFYGSPPAELMARLDLPSLEQLHFLSSHPNRMDTTTSAGLSQRLISSISMFGPQLVDIRFNHLFLENVEAIPQCFDNLLNLSSLQLDHSTPHFERSRLKIARPFEDALETLIVALTLYTDEQGGPLNVPMCPKLRRFACTIRMRGFTERQLSQFIIGRCRVRHGMGIVRLEEVDVSLGLLQETDIRRELEDSGVNLDRMRLRVQYDEFKGL